MKREKKKKFRLANFRSVVSENKLFSALGHEGQARTTFSLSLAAQFIFPAPSPFSKLLRGQRPPPPRVYLSMAHIRFHSSSSVGMGRDDADRDKGRLLNR